MKTNPFEQIDEAIWGYTLVCPQSTTVLRQRLLLAKLATGKIRRAVEEALDIHWAFARRLYCM